jgi:triphosphoribosyl-dephospho-CoA synthase
MPVPPSFYRFAGQAYLEACDLEIRAIKPGNVGDHAPGHDMVAEDFRRSAQVSMGPLTDGTLGVGERIYRAVEATQTAVGCNTNLGILLLSAPLIEAFVQKNSGEMLDERLPIVLKQLDLTDAHWLFGAIALAKPGGLGEAAEGDVNEAPTLTILEAMALAEARDFIARQYTRSFTDIFQLAVPMYHSRLSVGDSEEWATTAVFLGLLSQYRDSHVERKFGKVFADQVTREAASAFELFSGPVEPKNILGPLLGLDQSFKTRGINPGTTADLTVAALLAVRLMQEPSNEDLHETAET